MSSELKAKFNDAKDERDSVTAEPDRRAAVYFKETRSPGRGLFVYRTEKRFLVYRCGEVLEYVNAKELPKLLGVGSSNVDYFWCRDRARATREAGNMDGWIEYPTGKVVRNPENECGGSTR